MTNTNQKPLRTLVLGGGGFIGTHLSNRLHQQGATVKVIDSFSPWCGSTPENRQTLKNVGIPIVEIDISTTDISDHIADADVVFHLAGHTAHKQSVLQPSLDAELNIKTTTGLIESCQRIKKFPHIVYASTRQLYGRPQYLPVDEKHPLSPIDPNGINKLAAEELLRFFCQLNSQTAVILRLTNTYGPGQKINTPAQGFVGFFVHQVLKGENLQIFGDGKQRRDFSYVDDTVDALILASQLKMPEVQAFNLAGEIDSIAGIAHKVISIAKRGHVDFKDFPKLQQSIEIGDYYGSSAAFEKITGWKAKIGLSNGLEKTIQSFEGK